jgi:hypothetical protein
MLLPDDMFDYSSLAEKAIEQYKEKMNRICLECPYYPGNCPPKRCPVHTSVKLPPCATKATLFTLIKAHT